MNVLATIAGVTALLTTLGHFTVGRKMYLKPLLDSDIEPVAKKVLHCVFHYVSTFLIISTLALLMIGFDLRKDAMETRFISANYLVFAIWQLVLAKQSGIPKAPIKMFQWIFFIIIAVFSWLGAS